MAIGIHIVTVRGASADSKGNVVEDNFVETTAGGPTVADYLVAEAAGNFVATYIGFDRIVTYSATDINSA